MSHVSEHEELHAALGEQVAELSIGPSPTAAVLKDGAALRGRRRLALASGVTALAALPSPSVIAPQSDPDANATAPNPQDEVMVIAHGTIDGQRWRVVRDRYVIAAGDTSVSAWGGAGRDHFPMSEKTRAGVRVCEYLGVQWGDRPAGTVPDYRFSGTCADPAVKPGKQTVLVPFLSTNLPPSREGAVTVVIAKVDPSRVSSATVAVDGHISARQPVVTVIGSQNEGDRYSVFLVDPAYDEAGQPMLFTVYDDKGKTLESQPLAP